MATQSVSATQPKRELTFPKDSIGALYLVPAYMPVGEVALGASISVGAARSTRYVGVAPNAKLMLQANNHFLEVLKTNQPLSLSGIDTLKINFSLADSGNGDCDRALELLPKVKDSDKLRYLDLDQSDASDVGVKHMGALRSLEILSMTESNVKGNSFKDLLTLPKLSKIYFERASAPDSNYQMLTRFPHLTTLSLRWSNISSKQVEIVSHCKNLDDLNLSRNGNVDDSCMKYLSRLSKLSMLNLELTSVTDSGLAALAKCPNISILNLNHTNVSDLGLKHLLALKKLTSLDLNNTKATIGGLTMLAPLPLKKLILPTGSMSQNQYARLQKLFPNTTIAVPKVDAKDMDINEIMAPSH